MVNIDSPIGLWVSRHLTGGEIRTNLYKVKSGVTIFRGDPVIADTAGVVDVATAAPGAVLLGVAAQHVVGAVSSVWTSLSNILVYDDPFIVYGIQSDSSGEIAVAQIFANAQFRITHPGVSATGLSGYELDVATLGVTATHALKVLGLSNTRDPNNSWGLHADLEVLLNVNIFKSVGTAGLA